MTRAYDLTLPSYYSYEMVKSIAVGSMNSKHPNFEEFVTK